MKSKSTAVVFLLTLALFTACRKEKDLVQSGVDIRCNDFESFDCFTQNWVWGVNNKAQVVNDGYNSGGCLLITTDSVVPRQTVYTYINGLDSNDFYRLTFYLKYKKVLPHLPYQGHQIQFNINTTNMYYTAFLLNNHSEAPIVQDWIKHTALFQAQRDIPCQLSIYISDMDSVWVDDIVIDKF